MGLTRLLSRAPKTGARRRSVLVKELGEHDRRRMMKHFLHLETPDRLLRFGNVLTDEAVARYVAGIDFDRDKVFGVYSRTFRLVGVGLLAFAPASDRDTLAQATAKQQVAEFGVSVSTSARGKGVGSALFERAAIHCRNADVDVLIMHCLSSNKTMMHIARKAGMQIEREYGEADAYLKLPPPSPGSVLQEAMAEQAAMLDYTVKANRRAAAKWLEKLPRWPGRGRKPE
jgi:GNAT superfamily N-acetyltransferase